MWLFDYFHVLFPGEKEKVDIGTAEVAADETAAGNDNSDKAAEAVTASTEHAVLGPRVLAISSGKRESFHYAYDEPNENQGSDKCFFLNKVTGCVIVRLFVCTEGSR